MHLITCLHQPHHKVATAGQVAVQKVQVHAHAARHLGAWKHAETQSHQTMSCVQWLSCSQYLGAVEGIGSNQMQ